MVGKLRALTDKELPLHMERPTLSSPMAARHWRSNCQAAPPGRHSFSAGLGGLGNNRTRGAQVRANQEHDANAPKDLVNEVREPAKRAGDNIVVITMGLQGNRVVVHRINDAQRAGDREKDKRLISCPSESWIYVAQYNYINSNCDAEANERKESEPAHNVFTQRLAHRWRPATDARIAILHRGAAIRWSVGLSEGLITACLLRSSSR